MKQTQAMNDLNELIDETIDQLADDRVDMGVAALQELAVMWKSAGLPLSSWIDICGYIEQQAIEKSDEAFIKTKIHHALRDRDNKRIIVSVH